MHGKILLSVIQKWILTVVQLKYESALIGEDPGKGG